MIVIINIILVSVIDKKNLIKDMFSSSVFKVYFIR